MTSHAKLGAHQDEDGKEGDPVMDKAGSPTSTHHFGSLLSGVLRHATALTLVGAAFGYYAGYTYLDQLYREFGLTYGATSPTTAEVIGWGYVVTLYGLLKTIRSYLWIWAWQFGGGIIVFAILIVVGVKRPSFREWLVAKIDEHDPKIQLAAGRIAFGSVCFLILVTAGPWGAEAAKHDIIVIKRKVTAGCCFVYSDGATSAAGAVLAMDKDHVFVVSRRGVLTLSPTRLNITPTAPSTHGSAKP